MPNPGLKALKAGLKAGSTQNSTVVFSGGEPLSRKDILDIVRFARHECCFDTVAVETSATRLASYVYAQRIVEAGANCFLVSLHGHKSALHDYLTCRAGSFEETCTGIMNALSLSANVISYTAVTRPSVYNLADIANALTAMGVRKMKFIYPATGYSVNSGISNMIPLMTIAGRQLDLAADTASKNGGVVFAPDVPPCIFGEGIARQLSSAKRNTIHKAYWKRFGALIMHRHSTAAGPNGPACRDCHLADSCAGPPADYVEAFSWKEFRPFQQPAVKSL